MTNLIKIGDVVCKKSHKPFTSKEVTAIVAEIIEDYPVCATMNKTVVKTTCGSICPIEQLVLDSAYKESKTSKWFM